MKRPRQGLIATLYEARSNRCGTCGRRFFATEEGREKKAHHLDWHFKTNQRMADTAKRAQSRSWYVDERVSDDLLLPDQLSSLIFNRSLTPNHRTGLNLESMRMTRA